MTDTPKTETTAETIAEEALTDEALDGVAGGLQEFRVDTIAKIRTGDGKATVKKPKPV